MAIEIDVADPQPAQLDSPQSQPFGQDECELVEERVTACPGEVVSVR